MGGIDKTIDKGFKHYTRKIDKAVDTAARQLDMNIEEAGRTIDEKIGTIEDVRAYKEQQKIQQAELDLQKQEIAKQDELAAEQKRLIDEEKARQQAIKDERTRRMKGYTLLSGSETGTKNNLELLK